MADDVGGWRNLFNETSGKLYVDLGVLILFKLSSKLKLRFIERRILQRA